MNTKRFFAAIFAAAILSISFLACDPKEDDPTTNPTPSTDVVKEVYGYYGKTTDEVVAILDQKGWTKSIDSVSFLNPIGLMSILQTTFSDPSKKW